MSPDVVGNDHVIVPVVYNHPWLVRSRCRAGAPRDAWLEILEKQEGIAGMQTGGSGGPAIWSVTSSRYTCIVKTWGGSEASSASTLGWSDPL
jgi:hypothetical protein